MEISCQFSICKIPHRYLQMTLTWIVSSWMKYWIVAPEHNTYELNALLCITSLSPLTLKTGSLLQVFHLIVLTSASAPCWTVVILVSAVPKTLERVLTWYNGRPSSVDIIVFRQLFRLKVRSMDAGVRFAKKSLINYKQAERSREDIDAIIKSIDSTARDWKLLNTDEHCYADFCCCYSNLASCRGRVETSSCQGDGGDC